MGKWHANAGFAPSIEFDRLVVLPRKLNALACKCFGHDGLTMMNRSDCRSEIQYSGIDTR